MSIRSAVVDFLHELDSGKDLVDAVEANELARGLCGVAFFAQLHAWHERQRATRFHRAIQKRQNAQSQLEATRDALVACTDKVHTQDIEIRVSRLFMLDLSTALRCAPSRDEVTKAARIAGAAQANMQRLLALSGGSR